MIFEESEFGYIIRFVEPEDYDEEEATISQAPPSSELSGLFGSLVDNLWMTAQGLPPFLRTEGYVLHVGGRIANDKERLAAGIDVLSSLIPGAKGTGAAARGGRELFKFGRSAAVHLEERGRFVPIQILDQAIKGSTGIADPKGSRALMHTTEMWKNGKVYNLEVLFDKKTNSIWHFKYSR